MARVRLVTDAAEEVRRSRRVAVVVVDFIMVSLLYFVLLFCFCRRQEVSDLRRNS